MDDSEEVTAIAERCANLSLPELVELTHRIADEILLRMMEAAEQKPP